MAFIVIVTLIILGVLKYNKPDFFKKNRKLKTRGAFLFLAVFSVVAVISQKNNPESFGYSESQRQNIQRDKPKPDVDFYNQNKNLILEKLNDDYPRKDARKIATGFAIEKGIPPEFYDSFYYCLGDGTRTLSQKFQTYKVLDWCLGKYNDNPKQFVKDQSAYSYFDLKDQFNAWDGSHTKSVKAIKENMKDPSSFEHIETTYQYIGIDGNLRLKIITIFNGRNSFNAKVISRATTIVGAAAGDVFDIKIQ